MEMFSELNDSENNHVNLANFTKLCNINSLQEATFRWVMEEQAPRVRLTGY